MQNKDENIRLLILPAQSLLRGLDILLQLLDGILERGPRIIHLIHNQDIPSNQTRALQRTQVQPLGALDLGSRRFFRSLKAQIFVEG